MQRKDNSYLPVPTSKTDIVSYAEKLADRFNIPNHASRIKAITEKLYLKPYCQQQFTGYGLSLSLEEAFYNLSPEQALSLFEKTDLDVLANRVSLIRNWAGGFEPFYTHDELAEELRQFESFYDLKRDSLLAYGYPYEYFSTDRFFIKLTLMNPTLDPGWKVQGESSPFANSLKQWENFCALRFSNGEQTFLGDLRVKLHHIKSELCVLFYHALMHKEHTPQTLCDGAGSIIAKQLNRDEANQLLALERKYDGLFLYKAKIMDKWIGRQSKFLVDIGTGGLNAIIDATLFTAGELESSRIHEAKSTLVKLLGYRELDSYYRLWQVMGRPEIKKLNAFLDQNSDYFAVIADYGKHFEPLLTESIKKYITIPVTVKKEYAEKISHAAKHLEQGGELHLGDLTYTATGTKIPEPRVLEEKATPHDIIPGKFKVHITGLNNPRPQIFIDDREMQLSTGSFMLFLRLAVARKEAKDGMLLFKNEKLITHLSHQKMQRLRKDIEYQLKSPAEVIGNDNSGGYSLNTTPGRIKIAEAKLRAQANDIINDILNLLKKSTISPKKI